MLSVSFAVSSSRVVLLIWQEEKMLFICSASSHSLRGYREASEATLRVSGKQHH